jgi:hypothetical protein
MMKNTLLFGLLCTTPLQTAARLLENLSSSGNKDIYNVVLIEDYNHDENPGVVHPDPQPSEGGSDHASTTTIPTTTTTTSSGSTNDYYNVVLIEHTNDGNGVPDPSGSRDYGYAQAKMIWTDGYYDCANIADQYWVDVQNIVFNMCHFMWMSDSLWEQYAQECKTGAEDFVMQEMDKCIDITQCSQVGISAAAAVAGTFCKQNGLFHEQPAALPAAWLPSTQCVQHAQISCKYDAVETVQKFNQGGVCAQGSALNYIDEIHQLCEQEVSAMEQEVSPDGWRSRY